MPAEGTVLQYFMTQGPWAILFVVLFFWVLREHKRREEALIGVIDKLSDEIIPDLREIKQVVLKKND